MKKLALTIVSAVALAGAGFAQGTVQWVSPASFVIVHTNATQLSPLFGGGALPGGTEGNTPSVTVQTYYYTLLYSAYTGTQAAQPSTISSLLSWSWAGPAFYMTNGVVGNGRLIPVTSDTQAIVPWAPLTTSNVVLVGWSGNLGNSWMGVSNILATSSVFAPGSFFGVSATGYITAGGANPGTAIFGTGTGQIYNPSTSPMELYALPVPEPGTLALAGLGGLSLLLFRRRK